MRWIKDEEFIRGKVPMTKYEIRLVTIGLLEINTGDRLLDVGAGTGSVSIEAALQGAEVISVESNEEAVKLLHDNSEKFNAGLEIIEGKAPESIRNLKGYNKCFIGGSGGNMKEIFEIVNNELPQNGLFYANFITLKNMNSFMELLEKNSYKDIVVKLVQSSNVDGKTGLLKANNPVFIIGGRK